MTLLRNPTNVSYKRRLLAAIPQLHVRNHDDQLVLRSVSFPLQAILRLCQVTCKQSATAWGLYVTLAMRCTRGMADCLPRLSLPHIVRPPSLHHCCEPLTGAYKGRSSCTQVYFAGKNIHVFFHWFCAA